MIQVLFATVLLVIIFIFSFIFYRLNNIKKVTKKKEKEEEEIEILDVDDYNYFNISKQALKEVSQDTLNLDDLFKTMSINIIKDDSSFDFDLLRKK